MKGSSHWSAEHAQGARGAVRTAYSSPERRRPWRRSCGGGEHPMPAFPNWCVRTMPLSSGELPDTPAWLVVAGGHGEGSDAATAGHGGCARSNGEWKGDLAI